MTNLPSQLWKWDATDLAWGIRTRVISSREAVSSCLDRIEQVNPLLNAIVLILGDEALQRADEADRAVKRGVALGQLHGVPVTTKLNADQAGVPNSAGVVAYKDRIASADNPVTCSSLCTKSLIPTNVYASAIGLWTDSRIMQSNKPSNSDF